MPKLTELGLTNEQVGQALDYETIPDQQRSFADPPQPGSYRFKLPPDLSAIWSVFDHAKGNPPGKRVRAEFDATNPLVIVQSAGGVHNGDPFETSVSNAERKRGKKEDASAPWVSDMDYINKDVFGLPTKPTTNAAYAQEFMKHGGEEFTAEVTWRWSCNPERNIFADNGSGQLVEYDQKGCGAAYYPRDVEKVRANLEDPNSPLVFPRRMVCKQCGANLRAFAGLQNFQK